MILDLGRLPSKPLSINEANKMHWAQKRRRLHVWRVSTLAAWRSTSQAEREEVTNRKVQVTLVLAFPSKRTRDPHNYVVTAKAVIDELTGHCWPDDSPEWVSVAEPQLIIGDFTHKLIIEEIK